MRNLALAVLWTVISLSGLSDLDNSPGDFDDGDDGGVECLELHRGGERSPSRVLEAASDVCGKPIESAWVARDGHGRCAAAAVQHTEDYSFVVSVTLDGRDDGPARIAAAALEGALDHCREAGALKVIIQGPGRAATALRAIAEGRGFQFSRVMESDEMRSMEFYTDLYWHPRFAEEST